MNDENKIIIECLNTFGRVPEQWELLKMIKELQSNWNSLREYCEENKYFYSGYQGEDREEDLAIKGVLDKMNELEGKDKEC